MAYDKILAARQRHRHVELAKKSLWFLATDILGYDRLTVDFHKPLCQAWDKDRDWPRQLDLWPRGHYKTTLGVARVIQSILIDPNITWLICHAVDEEVQKIVEEIGQHFTKTSELRKLCPEICPHPLNKRFLKANEFTVRRERYNRQPTVLGKSSGSEITGAHCGRIWLDDIVGRKTLEDSALPKVKSWYRNTVLPVLDPGGVVAVTGTRWDISDPYGDWLKEPSWHCRVRWALVDAEGKPDVNGTPVLFSADELARRQRDMGPDFGPQMMQDPSPPGEKPWGPNCEHIVPLKEVAGPGTLICLSDPAPARVGSLDDSAAKRRADGTKDDWAIAVVKLRKNGQRNEIVWLDGATSKDWDLEEGYRAAARLMRRWGAYKFAEERLGQAVALFDGVARRVFREEGVKYQPTEMQGTYRGNAKNVYFGALCSRAMSDEFLICETVPEKVREQFFEQARNWRPMPGGKNGLKFDDLANCVSFSTDPGLRNLAPDVQPEEWNPFLSNRKDEETMGTRYVRW